MIDANKTWTDAELKALPPIAVDPGTTDANGVTRNRHLRNPFAETDESLAHRWSDIHWADKSNETAAEADPFILLRNALDAQRLWAESRGENGDLVAVHPLVPTYQPDSPTQRTAESDWESRCLSMHENQRTITLSEKTKVPISRPTRIVTDLDSHSAPMKYEDSAESQRLRRGD